MEFIEKILDNQTVVTNAIMLVSVLISFLISVLCGSKYNSGGSKTYLVMSRIMIILAAVLVLIWLFK